MRAAVFKYLPKLGVSILVFGLQIHVAYASTTCVELFATEITTEQLLSSNPKVESIRLRIANDHTSAIKSSSEVAFKKLESLIEQAPVLRKEQSSKLVSQLIALIEQEDQSIHHMTISELINKVQQQSNLDSLTYEELMSLLKQKLYTILENRMSDKTAQTRSQALGVRTLKFALGELSSKQVKVELLGTVEGQIAPTSLMGKYLTEIQETASRPGLYETRQFPKAPTGTEIGIEKLAVESSSLAYQKYFSANPNFLSHIHTSRQGTLHLQYLGRDVSYARSSPNDNSRVDISESRVPLIILSTSEANRVHNYFKLGQHDSSRSKTPSRYKNSVTDEFYISVGGAYGCCSHWFGEMPFGDEFVSKYRFPGKVDGHGNTLYSGKSEEELMQPGVFGLGTYDNYNGVSVGNTSQIDRLTRIVWKTGKGPSQMWQVLGLRDQLDAAELTNPGYILYALMSSASNDRVPVVLVPKTGQELQTNQVIMNNISFY